MNRQVSCNNSAMKILFTFVTLLWAFSAPLFGQTPEPQQTPDAIEDSEPAPTPEPTEASKPLSQRDNALIQSAYDGDLAMVEILVSKGTAVNVRDQRKRTPLILAAHNGHTEVVEFLFSQGADINARESDRQSALMYAARRSFNETAVFLLKSGAEVNNQSRKQGVTALMLATVSDNAELVQMLLEHGADADLRNIFGKTAKGLAEEWGNSAVADLLPDSPMPDATNP